MNSVQIAPRVWLNDGIFYGSNESSTDEPLYDQSAIDQLIAERDVLRIEKDRLQEIRQQLEAARDVALADAESLRRRMLVLERQRDEFVSREWQGEKAKRKAESERDVAEAEVARIKASVGAIHYAVRSGFSDQSILDECVEAAPELTKIASETTGDET